MIKKKMPQHTCEGKIRSGSTWHPSYRACGKTATLEHEGRWFCKTHHPPTQRARLDATWAAKQAKWDSQRESLDEVYRKAAAYDKLVKLLEMFN